MKIIECDRGVTVHFTASEYRQIQRYPYISNARYCKTAAIVVEMLDRIQNLGAKSKNLDLAPAPHGARPVGKRGMVFAQR